ncbi:MAG: helix-turn-helix domain containing protein [Firmicutes bacterium]|nr:helix-turn-helix domain containing protein [Bacillota bacterium]
MSGETKKRIPEAALELFSQNGYVGTSMSDIAKRLGITKPALYKHYAGKHEILERIVELMNENDFARAKEYEMPETGPDGFAEAYVNIPIEKIRAYSMAQFRYWTEEEFSSQFRKMLTIEQYRDEEMSRLYQNYIAAGPAEYMAAIFRKMTDSDEAAMQLALDFYGPMHLLYSIYDGAENKEAVYKLLDEHIDRFFSKMKS